MLFNLINNAGAVLASCATSGGVLSAGAIVGIIIAVVVGVLLMGIVYAFIKGNIQTRLDTEIGNLWDYTA